MTALVSLSQNIALLLALTFLYGFIYPSLTRFSRRMIDVVNGLLFGSFAVITMTQPIEIMPGAFYDGRTVVIAIAGLYGGPIPVLIAVTMACVFRLSLGGVGMVGGIGAALTVASLSILVRHYLRHRGQFYPSNKELIAVGVALSLIGGTWALLVFNFNFAILERTIPNTILLYPLGMLLLGSLLTSQRHSRETEAALRQSEQRFRAIFDSSSQHMSLLTPDGTILEINQTALRKMNVAFDQVDGRRFWEIFPQIPLESKAKLENAIHRAARGETVRYEVNDWMPDGLVFDFTLTPILDEQGNVAMLIPEWRDISIRKRAELALQESERRYRALFDSTFEFIGLMKPDGTLLQANRTMLDFYDLTLDDVVGHPLWDVLPTDAVEVKRLLKDAIVRAAHGEFIRYETELTGKNRNVTIDFSLTPITDADGEVVLLLPEGHDITERKHFEQQKLELALERERSGLLKKFVNDISHDLRTPLSVIRLNLELLQRTVDPEQQRKRYDVLIREADHLTRLLDDMRIMLRLDDDATDTSSFVPLDVNVFIQEMIDKQRRSAQRKQITLEIDYAPTELVINGSDEELRRALSNLLVNAISYTNAGGTISITTTMARDCAVIEVRDTGIGISAADLPHVFQRFYRADQARSIDTGGSGLGLTITKKIVEGHGGSIEAESTFGVGSTFRVRLPLMLQKVKEPAHKSA